MADNTTNLETKDTTQTEPTAAPTSTQDYEKRIKDLESQLAKQKKAMDAACTDAANWKDKYNSTLTEAQKAEAKRKEEEAAKDRRIAELERKEVVSAYSNRALSLGYDADLAAQTAEAMANGDMDAVFAGIGQLIQTVKTKTVTENLGKQSTLSTGVAPSTNTVQLDEENKYRKWMGLPPLKN